MMLGAGETAFRTSTAACTTPIVYLQATLSMSLLRYMQSLDMLQWLSFGRTVVGSPGQCHASDMP